MKFLILLGIFIMPTIAQVWHPSQQTVNIDHYTLDIRVDEKQKKVWGNVTYTVFPLWENVEKTTLDAGDMTVNKVTSGSKDLRFSHEGRKLTIQFSRKYRRAESINFTIHYTAFPKRGTYFVQPNHSYPNKPYQVWTQGEAEETHYWFPCYDFPNQLCTSETMVSVRKPYTAISNGKLQKIIEEADGWRKFHWKTSVPHVSYLVSLVIGDFVELNDNFEDIPLQYYMQKKDVPNALRSFGKTPKMMDFFSKLTGTKYPYEKYAQTPVEEFTFGGMENVSASTYNQNTIHDKRAHLNWSSDSLVAHELAHQWWGDLLTCRDWSQIWLNEGFATYYTVLWLEHDMGKDQAKEELLGEYEWYIGSDRHPMVWKTFKHRDDVFDSHAYAKGAWILHMLRKTFGHDSFVRATQLYLNRHRGRAVTTIDLQNAFEDTLGKNLDWFFKQWIYGIGHPQFQVSWKWDNKHQMAVLHVKQTQKQSPFRVTLPIELTTKSGKKVYTVDLEGREQRIYLPSKEQPLFIAFDKDGTILKELKMEQTQQQWIEQLSKDSDFYGRLNAAKALVKYPSDKAITALGKALKNDSFYGVRSRIASLLGSVHSKEAASHLIAAIADKDARVRASIVNALAKNRFNRKTAVPALKSMFHNDMSYRVQANSIKALSKYTKNGTDLSTKDMMELLNEALKMDSHLNVIRQAALSVATDVEKHEGLEILRSWVKPGKPIRCRTTAMNEIFKEEKGKKSLMLNSLIKQLGDSDHRIRSAAISLLEELGSKKAIPALIKISENDDLLSLQNSATKAITNLKK
ncbi:M1 family aminopeptidase [Candidatus Uabimicrobium sp. HlEnr_7]|uniref:M1 family aminopeptidase n=1 Tax=Candidatus Uabimicrobium helgolandensis TaxID=3095367 RepID=UPI003557C2D8